VTGTAIAEPNGASTKTVSLPRVLHR
jgi:hypothetical protein